MKKHLLIGVMAAVLAFPMLHPAAAEPVDAAAQAQALTQAQTLGQSQAQNAEDRATLIEARVAALKAGLKLNSAQDKNWDSLEKVLREVIDARAARRKTFQEQSAEFHEKDEVIKGMKLGGRDLVARGEELLKVADAASPLFDSLDAAQKHRFTLLLRSFAASSALK